MFSNFDEGALVCRVVVAFLNPGEVKEGLAEERHVDFGGNLDEGFFLPLTVF